MTKFKITRALGLVKQKWQVKANELFRAALSESPGGQLRTKRKSDDPCRWVIAFLVPCGTGRVNDKKVNEENSKVKNKGVCGAEFAAPK